jgi:hypothetical protein
LYQGWAQFFGTPDLQPAMARVTQAGSKAVRKRVSGQIILLCYWNFVSQTVGIIILALLNLSMKVINSISKTLILCASA